MFDRDSANKDKPMTEDWWANTTGEVGADGKYDWNWTSTSDFRNWILNNKSQNDYGIQGISYTEPTYMKIGDYVYDPGHVMFITKITDNDGDGYTDWDEIYISAHTNNRKNHNLKALYGGVAVPPSDFEFINIYGFLFSIL
ncbi:amidase domain-containing protein [Caldisalinibacter kiritimatiensis]|uniref:Uncharacterized protein n=1 Tax=Caldisalinibacter kiritimatiensis TaxID=1304284 RepID=R1CSS9_9FIRM|nr:amidase domain-containing protein [Caldisalinibacter kiritimatiensis]EOD01711.1 hypothetical protein L21TH_0252 [Caldisalinibacter kiritimatiensis]